MFVSLLTRLVWHEATAKPLGGTLTLPDLLPPTTGFIVAVAATQDSFGIEGCESTVRHALKAGLLIGWWTNEDGEVQFDACLQIADRQAAEDRGRAEGQRAIFDLDTLTEIRL